MVAHDSNQREVNWVAANTFFKITLQSLKSWRWSTAMKKKNYMGPWVVVVVIIIIIIMFIIIIIIIIIIIQDVLV